MRDIKIVTACSEHIDDIVIIENLSFKIPWSRQSIIDEILGNNLAVYFSAVVGGKSETAGTAGEPERGSQSRETGKVVGYAGMWRVLEEGHITNIAVHPEFRGSGVGSALMEALLAAAGELGITALTLEVRRSNQAAKALYRKYGFAESGMRKAYYADNNEDAIIMWKRLDQG